MYQMRPRHDLRKGERVGVWARPTDNDLYLFGYGHYVGEEAFNGESHPVIRLDDNPHEVYVIHYQHVSYGREAGIQRTCSNFKGRVSSVNLKEFLDPDFEPPIPHDSTPGEPQKAKEPPKPKTAFDKLHLLGREVSVMRQKLEVLNTEITKTNQVIQDKLELMKEVKDKAFAEVTALEKGEELTPFVDPDEPQQNPTRTRVSTGDSETPTERPDYDGGINDHNESLSSNPSHECVTCGSTLGPTGCVVCN